MKLVEYLVSLVSSLFSNKSEAEVVAPVHASQLPPVASPIAAASIVSFTKPAVHKVKINHIRQKLILPHPTNPDKILVGPDEKNLVVWKKAGKNGSQYRYRRLHHHQASVSLLARFVDQAQRLPAAA